MCREMKDSGVKWIGCIPKTWNITKIKMLSDIYTGTSISDDLKDKYTVKENATPYISTKDLDVSYKSIDYDNGLFIPNGEKGFRLAEKDSTLICIEGGSAGKKVAFTDREVNFVNKLCCIKSRNYNNKFIYYYINSSAFTEQFNLNLSGLIGGVSINLLKQIITVVPTVAEQQKISNYLDKKVSQIDDIISKQKSLIEKYKAYKQSLITETVTKGLNKNVPMKDSGIEWIGDIPSNWNLSKVKHILEDGKDGIRIGPFGSALKSESIYESGEYKVYGQTHLINEDFKIGKKYIDNEKFTELSNYEIKPGDTLISMMGTIGKCTVVPNGIEKGIMDSHLIRLKMNLQKVIPRYFEYYFGKSKTVKLQLECVSKGSIMSGLNSEIIKSIFISYPSIEEQQQIIDLLDKKCNAIDSAIAKKEQLIEKLENYKKSLIYECVTGKREVN